MGEEMSGSTDVETNSLIMHEIEIALDEEKCEHPMHFYEEWAHGGRANWICITACTACDYKNDLQVCEEYVNAVRKMSKILKRCMECEKIDSIGSFITFVKK